MTCFQSGMRILSSTSRAWFGRQKDKVIARLRTFSKALAAQSSEGDCSSLVLVRRAWRRHNAGGKLHHDPRPTLGLVRDFVADNRLNSSRRIPLVLISHDLRIHPFRPRGELPVRRNGILLGG
jgi:hypothetical protein